MNISYLYASVYFKNTQKYLCKCLFVAHICMAFVGNAAAQEGVIPGYQGKRFLLEANLNVTPTILGFTSSGHSFSSVSQPLLTGFGVPISTRYELSALYATSRQFALVADVAYGETGMFVSKLDRQNYIGGDYYYDLDKFNGYNFDDLRAVLYKVNFNHVGLGFNVSSKKGSFAPVGSYFGMKFLYVSANAAPVRFLTDDASYSSRVVEASSAGDRYQAAIQLRKPYINSLYFEFNGGFRRVFQKNIVLNAGYSFAIAPQHLFSRNPITDRLDKHYLLHLQIGVGYLLF